MINYMNRQNLYNSCVLSTVPVNVHELLLNNTWPFHYLINTVLSHGNSHVRKPKTNSNESVYITQLIYLEPI